MYLSYILQYIYNNNTTFLKVLLLYTNQGRIWSGKNYLYIEYQNADT